MLGCVILNFNDSETTKKLVNNIKSYTVIDYIIIVDNKSTDNSFLELKKIENEDSKIKVIESPKNGGYGYGNNVGICYCKQIGCSYVLIANPDVEFSEDVILASLYFLQKDKDKDNKCAAVAPRMEGGGAIKFASPFKDSMFSVMLLNKIFKPRKYPDKFYLGKKWAYVDALPGSLVMFDLQKFYSVGLYDENIFLYHEEVIVGKKLAKHGYKTVLLLDLFYQHHHSVTVKKCYKKSIKPKEFAMMSHRYYLKNYCNANRIILCIFSILANIARLEMFLWLHIKK